MKLNIVRDSTGVITAKLLAEGKNTQADVVWGTAASSLLALDKKDMLKGYSQKEQIVFFRNLKMISNLKNG